MFQAILFVISLVLSLLIGCQTRDWSWGPALLVLSVALFFVASGSARKLHAHPWKTSWSSAIYLTAFSYFVCRAWLSPVQGFRTSDFLLVLSCAGSFLATKDLSNREHSLKIFLIGFALLFGFSLVVSFIQVKDPGYDFLMRARHSPSPSGLFAAYNESANYLLACTLISVALALFYPAGRVWKAAWLLLALLGATGVYFTRSRGGNLGLAVGFVVLGLYATLFAKRAGLRWAKPAIVALPILVLAVTSLLAVSWSNAQRARGQQEGVQALMDNTCRYYMADTALRTTSLHPWLGGGAGSFSWESLQAWAAGNEIMDRLPEYVHNEMLQVFTDYGIIGSALLLAVIFTLFTNPLLTSHVSKASPVDLRNAGLVSAGASSLAGMLVQSSFSYVFHMLPGTMLLGMSAGLLAHRNPEHSQSAIPKKWHGASMRAVALLTGLAILPFGIQATRATIQLYPIYFGDKVITEEEKIDRISQAIVSWPSDALYFERSLLTFPSTGTEKTTSPDIPDPQKDLLTCIALNPHNPQYDLNLGHLSSLRGDRNEARRWFESAISKQGRFEPAYRSKMMLANTYHDSAGESMKAQDADAALHDIRRAVELMRESEKAGGFTWEERGRLLDMVARMARIEHATGMLREAIASYNEAMKSPRNSYIRAFAAEAYGRMAEEEWKQRKPGEALRDFHRALALMKSAKPVPGHFTEKQRTELIKFYEARIRFLRSARVQPAK